MILAIAGVLPCSSPFVPSAKAQGFTENLLGCSEPGVPGIKRCLKYLMFYHCAEIARKHFYNPVHVGRGALCDGAVLDIVAELDPEQLNLGETDESRRGLREVAFASSIEPAFLDPKLESVLGALTEEFSESCRFDLSRSFWSTLLSAYSHEKALSMAAIAFQSVSFFQNGGEDARDGGLMHLEKVLQVAHAKELASRAVPGQQNTLKQESSQLTKNAGLYHALAKEWINRKIKGGQCSAYSFYPDIPHAGDLNPTLHHFYVPAYLAAKLRGRGQNHKWSLFAPFLMNTLWEFRKIDRKLGQNRWPYRAPSPPRSAEEAARVEMNYRKIYTGYLGAIWGMGLQAHALSYAEFRARFGTADFSFIWDGKYLR